MKKILVGAAATAATLAFATGAMAVGPPYCGTYATPSITAADPGIARECQAAIAANTQKYIKSFVKTRGKCLKKGLYDACPNTKDDTKVQDAGGTAAAAIAAACGSTVGLGSSYDGATGENVASCTLSQNHATAEIFIGETHGTAGFPDTVVEARNDCQLGLNKSSEKYMLAVLKAVDKCIEGRVSDGNVTGLGAACVGSLASGGLTPPGDQATADAITKAKDKLLAGLDKGCTGLSSGNIADLFGCPGAASEADLDTCAECSGLNAVFEIVGQQYAETAPVISPAAGILQTTVDAGSPGDKFLIASGDYAESVHLPNATCVVGGGSCLTNADCPSDDCVSDGDGMQLVGCGAATDDRPRIVPPPLTILTDGVSAAGVDGLLFQSLEVTGWSENGIHVISGDDVTFRDCLGDGDDQSTPAEVDPVSTYAFFPITSTNVTVEGCEVKNIRDAGIYVGQSIGITVRHNLVHDNVTGIEIENSENADVYGNTAHGNTGGLLSFKLPGGLPKQTSGGHHFFDNVSYSNDTPNFGIPGSTVGNVPRGTGVMIISEDDSTFENNLVELNDAYGILIVDQNAVNTLIDPDPFVPVSHSCGALAAESGTWCTDNGDCTGDTCNEDQFSERLKFLNNHLTPGQNRNGLHPDPEALLAGNWTWGLEDGEGRDTCWKPLPNGPFLIYGVTAADIILCP